MSQNLRCLRFSQSFCNIRMGSMLVEFWLLCLVEISVAIADVLLQLELIILIQVEFHMCSTAPSQCLCGPFNLALHTPMRSSVQRPCSALAWSLPLCRAHVRVQQGSTAVAFLSAPATLASQHNGPWPSQRTQSPMLPQ